VGGEKKQQVRGELYACCGAPYVLPKAMRLGDRARLGWGRSVVGVLVDTHGRRGWPEAEGTKNWQRMIAT